MRPFFADREVFRAGSASEREERFFALKSTFFRGRGRKAQAPRGRKAQAARILTPRGKKAHGQKRPAFLRRTDGEGIAMIHGIGTDILKLERFGTPDADDVFVRKCFTEKERAQVFAQEKPHCRLAARFAGKEAVFKALRMDPDRARLDEIEILSDEFGAPCVTLHGRMADYAASVKVQRVHLSLSWEEDCAIAFAVAERAEDSSEASDRE